MKPASLKMLGELGARIETASVSTATWLENSRRRQEDLKNEG